MNEIPTGKSENGWISGLVLFGHFEMDVYLDSSSGYSIVCVIYNVFYFDLIERLRPFKFPI